MADIPQPDEYPRIRRLPIGRHEGGSEKDALPSKALKILLEQDVVVEEKMDGEGAVLRAEGGRILLFCEDLRSAHRISYRIPARYCVFDIFSNGLFLGAHEKEEAFRRIRKGKIRIEGAAETEVFLAPKLGSGRFSLERLAAFLDIPSRYAYDPETGLNTFGEGIVVKPARLLFYAELGHYAAKLVRGDFLPAHEPSGRLNLINLINPLFEISPD
ncbi:MAG: RNA ligase family protein [Elusimicrobia bacterium]|nr:RNA ligase family protein [Elusimicrobiota bacterium]